MSNVFSVIIPTYKGCDSIHIALESLVKQTYKNFEVIISDDNGKDSEYQIKTQEIVSKYKDKLNIKYLINKHVNGSYARNQGLVNASGKFICFLDDDDFYLSDYLSKVKNAFEKEEDSFFVFVSVAIVLKEGVSRIVNCADMDSKSLLFYKKEIGTGSNICFRREAFDEDGGFDDSYLRLQDIEFISKKLVKYKAISLNEILLVKFYNANDNFPNFDRNIEMCKKLRDDALKKGIINETEYMELKDNQLINVLKDMLVKNSPKSDVKNVRRMIGKMPLIVQISYDVYMLSSGLFNIIFKLIFPSNNKGDDNNIKELIEYRNRLDKELI